LAIFGHFLVFFGDFWPFFVFLVDYVILVFLGHFGLFLVFFQLLCFPLINALVPDFLMILANRGVFRGFGDFWCF